MSLVEEECAEISRRIDTGSYDKGTIVPGGILVHPVNTTQSDFSHISGTIFVQTTSTGSIYNISWIKKVVYFINSIPYLQMCTNYTFIMFSRWWSSCVYSYKW